MIQYKHEATYQERARMADAIGVACRGRDPHRDAEFINKLVVQDWDTMASFLMFLQRTGCFPHGAVRRLYSRWCSKTEATWMDEWKRWSANVQRSE